MKRIARHVKSRVFNAAPGLQRAIGRRAIDSRERLHRYWSQPSPRGGEPEILITRVQRSAALYKLIRQEFQPDASILEVGCNAGRNLAYLHNHGYRNLSGIEINAHAVQVLRAKYPELAGIKVQVASAEDALRVFPDRYFDLIFTMAVIEHIHPNSQEVFDHMTRVGKNVLAIEPRGRISHRQFPHDVEQIFVARGFKLVWSTSMASMPETAEDPSMSHYFAQYFKRD